MASYAGVPNVEITRHLDADPDEDVWVDGPPPAEPIEIVTYDPTWPTRFATLAREVRAALGPVVLDIGHVGSTAVEGLPAKDVIDLDLTIADPRDEASYVPALTARGWRHTVREPSFHEHRLLRLDRPRANLHVFGLDCPEVIRHRIFRDWLRTHPDERDRYADAKRAAATGGGTVMAYNARKQAVIREIYDRAFRAAGLL